jgi:hypothetical protein
MIGFKPTLDALSAQLILFLPDIPNLHVAHKRQGMLDALLFQRTGDGYIRNPVLTPSLCPLVNTFAIEIRRQMLEEGGRDAVQSMHVDYRIEAPINLTGHKGDVLALLTN